MSYRYELTSGGFRRAQRCHQLTPIHNKASLLELVQLQRPVQLVQLQHLVQLVQLRQLVHLVQLLQLVLVHLPGVFKTIELFSDRELHHVLLALPWQLQVTPHSSLILVHPTLLSPLNSSR